MEFHKTNIKDVIILQPKLFCDNRGCFIESFNLRAFQKNFGKKIVFCQDNESKSSYGVLRGLHFQKPPFTQSKLIRVISGRVLDVVVDLREDSRTFTQTFSIELNDKNKKQLFVPKGFAHGFVVLSDEAILSYKVDEYYSPCHEGGLMYNDSLLNIDWVVEEKDIRLSQKDKKNHCIKDVYKYRGNLYD